MREEFIFPPPAPPDSPFQLRLAGTSYCDGSYLIARRNSGDWVIEFVERGRGTLEVDGRTCHPEAGDLYFVPAGSTHRYWSSAEEPWVKHWMNFSGELIRELVRLYRLESVLLVRNFSRPELFKEALRRFRRHPEIIHSQTGPEFLTAAITTMAADLAAAAEAPPKHSEQGMQLRSILEAAVFETGPTLDDLATAISRSKVQAIRIFKRDFGETPGQYLLNRKLEAARELLRNTTCPLKEIAAMLKFSDEYYFASIFKRKTGLAPGRYRSCRTPGNDC